MTDPERLVVTARDGDPRALARLVSLVENGSPRLREVMKLIAPLTGRARVIGLTDAFDHLSMGESTERHNVRLNISREEQDEFAARSHQRAAAAIKNGLLAEEIVPVSVPQRRGEPVIFDTDEGVRADTTAESLSRLRPAFGPRSRSPPWPTRRW